MAIRVDIEALKAQYRRQLEAARTAVTTIEGKLAALDLLYADLHQGPSGTSVALPAIPPRPQVFIAPRPPDPDPAAVPIARGGIYPITMADVERIASQMKGDFTYKQVAEQAVREFGQAVVSSTVRVNLTRLPQKLDPAIKIVEPGLGKRPAIYRSLKAEEVARR